MSKKKTGTLFKIIKMYRKGKNTFWKQIVSKLTGNLWYNQVNEVSKSGQGNLPNGMEKIRESSGISSIDRIYQPCSVHSTFQILPASSDCYHAPFEVRQS